MKKLTIILTSCLIVVSMLALPIETRAKTISQFEAEAEKLTKELEEQKSKLVTNEKEIKEIKAKISDIENQVTTPETSLFTGMSRGDLAYGASVIANARKDFLSRAYVSEKFLSVDNNTSIYNYIRIVTGDMKYTKDKIDSMNAEHKLSKKLK